MSELKAWAFSICAAAVLSSLYTLMMPKGGTQRALKLMIDLFLLVCILFPLYNIADIELPKYSMDIMYTEGAQAFDTLAQLQIETNLKQLVTDKLSQIGINPTDIRIDISVTEDSVSVNNIQIQLSSTDGEKAEQIKQQLQKELLLPIQVETVE